MENEEWVHCEQCGKRLLKKLPNGVFEFRFGRVFGEGKIEDIIEPAILLEIHGSLRIKCFRRNCKHINVITIFNENNQRKVEKE